MPKNFESRVGLIQCVALINWVALTQHWQSLVTDSLIIRVFFTRNTAIPGIFDTDELKSALIFQMMGIWRVLLFTKKHFFLSFEPLENHVRFLKNNNDINGIVPSSINLKLHFHSSENKSQRNQEIFIERTYECGDLDWHKGHLSF